ncbi:unnamed protein product [Rhizophagus irregularis]|nr:unnamed protein product [Rhizophagus irregularis]
MPQIRQIRQASLTQYYAKYKVLTLEELRSAGRTKNSIITRGNVQNIEPLFVNSGRLPMNYPTTRHELRSLNGEEVRELLSAYDIKIGDNETENEQKNKLATFLGIF